MITLMTMNQVCKATSLSRTTIWRLQKRDEFPRGVRISAARVAYKASDIEAWIALRAASTVH